MPQPKKIDLMLPSGKTYIGLDPAIVLVQYKKGKIPLEAMARENETVPWKALSQIIDLSKFIEKSNPPSQIPTQEKKQLQANPTLDPATDIPIAPKTPSDKSKQKVNNSGAAGLPDRVDLSLPNGEFRNAVDIGTVFAEWTQGKLPPKTQARNGPGDLWRPVFEVLQLGPPQPLNKKPIKAIEEDNDEDEIEDDLITRKNSKGRHQTPIVKVNLINSPLVSRGGIGPILVEILVTILTGGILGGVGPAMAGRGTGSLLTSVIAFLVVLISSAVTCGILLTVWIFVWPIFVLVKLVLDVIKSA